MTRQISLLVNEVPINLDYFVQGFIAHTTAGMLAALEGALAHINRISKHHSPGTVTYHHGEADHAAYLSRPFLEARKAVLKRMRDAGIGI